MRIETKMVKIIKIIIISILCGLTAFLACAYIHTLEGPSGGFADPMGYGLAELFALVICVFGGAATFAIVLGLQLKGAKVTTIIGLSLIPVVIYSSIVLVNHFKKEQRWKEYVYNQRIDEVGEIDNPFETKRKKVILAKLKAGENIDKTNKKGQTLLHYAAYCSDFSLLKFAVEHGADVNKKDYRGLTAAAYINPEGRTLMDKKFNPWTMFAYLANNGADLTNLGNDDCSLLFYAVKYAEPEDVSMLIKHGISANTVYKGRTPLFTVRPPNMVKKAQVLIDAGADVNFQSSDEYKTFPILQYTDEMLYNDKGLTETFVIFRYSDGNKYYKESDRDVLQLLVKAGADIEVRNSSGDTPLLKASDYQSFNTVLFLINNGANVNAKNDKDDTPLLLAAYKTYASSKRKEKERDVALLKMLVEHGADKNATGSEEKTAYDFLLWERGFKEHEIEFLKP